jgi:DNA helicase-2/ATP-dependent DNA helicase PcrA
MGMQIGVYGLAARHELEYDPQHGLVRYIGERDPLRRQLHVDLSDADLTAVRHRVAETGARIRQRDFAGGPTGLVRERCSRCDFNLTCPHEEAHRHRARFEHL